MTERERTIIRVVGLGLHAVGLAVLLAAVLVGPWALGVAGALMFLVGGAWGWGMVLAAARRDAEDRLAARGAAEYRARAGFSGSFDDEPEPVQRSVGPPPMTGAP